MILPRALPWAGLLCRFGAKRGVTHWNRRGATFHFCRTLANQLMSVTLSANTSPLFSLAHSKRHRSAAAGNRRSAREGVVGRRETAAGVGARNGEHAVALVVR